jgi:hypothetical protein
MIFYKDSKGKFEETGISEDNFNIDVGKMSENNINFFIKWLRLLHLEENIPKLKNQEIWLLSGIFI